MSEASSATDIPPTAPDAVTWSDASVDPDGSISACRALGVEKAILLLPEEFKTEFGRHPELLTATVSENDRSWFLDRDVYGDVVDLVRRAFDDPDRRASARRIIDWVQTFPEGSRHLVRPERLDSNTPHGRNFPVRLLPPDLRNFVVEVSTVRDIPVEIVASAALGVMSGTTGKALRARSIGGMTVLPNLNFIIGTPTGLGKSITGGVVFGPVYAYELRAQAKHCKRLVETAAALAAVRQELAALAKVEMTGQGEATAAGELRAKERDLAAQIEPPRFVAEDATSEGLTALMAKHDGTLFSLSADARAIMKVLCGRYRQGRSTDEDPYLKAFSQDSMRQDRVTREAVMVVPCLAICWLTQTDYLALMFNQDAFRDSGLACRFLPCRVVSHRRRSAYEEVTLSPSAGAVYERRIWELMDAYRQWKGEPYVISATPEARRIIIDYDHEIEEMKEAGDLNDLVGFASRWAEMSWKLALTLHATEHGRDAHTLSVSAQNAYAAVEIIRWFARQQLGLLGDAAEEKNDERLNAARKLVQGSPGGTTPRLLQKAYGGLFASSEEARKTLEALVGEGGAFRHGTGKRPKYCPQRAPRH